MSKREMGSFFFFPFSFFSLFGHTAFRILVPQPGIEPEPPAVEGPSPNHWADQELPEKFHFY